MYNRIKSIVLALILCPIVGLSQHCHFVLSGNVEDFDTGFALQAVNVYLEETGNGAVTDSTGFFEIKDLCAGDYHVVFSHIGCASQEFFMQIRRDTVVHIHLEHAANVLDGIVVTGNSTPITTQNTQVLQEQAISDNANQNLSTLLESVTGVSSLKNGNGIAKPVVHGLYGNRLTILNNGVAQSGQQWGNDHSPEIDPLVANKIRVIKGGSAVAYPGANLGSVILVEPEAIGREPHLHGKATYFFESNGLSNGLNLQLKQYTPAIAWKINGTIKRSGDRNTPDYFLRNTGSQEFNLALQLEKQFSDHLKSEFYFSSFNTQLGVLRGAHIGNLTDLRTAFGRTEPFFTEENFHYSIDAPKQEVHHQLLKIRTKYFLDDHQWFDFTIAAQLNERKEFDLRRSGRTEIPALSLRQITSLLEAKYHKELRHDVKFNTGIQVTITDNTNNPETGILPLVPDYLAYESGAYLSATKKAGRSFWEFGARYDHIYQSIVKVTSNRQVESLIQQFDNFSGLLGYRYALHTQVRLAGNLGYASRYPAINERYSQGLHQGVSGIEEGNPDLKTEQALKATLSLSGTIHERLSFEGLCYVQQINDYIYLEPQDEIRLTIRGAFPVFRYKQTDALLYGLDASTQFQLSEALQLKLSYSYLKGENRSRNLPLIGLPSNRIQGSIAYEVHTPIGSGKQQFENLRFELHHQYVFQQNELLPEQDFLSAPDAYSLLSARISTDLQSQKTRLRLFLKADNILNTRYRDYLNRQRYFADELGFNLSIGGSLKF